MVRRTKEEAQATRQRLLDSAEVMFQAHGVSRTSLLEIARHAGVTRGAIYWHFKDKADLYIAMMDRVTLPLEQGFQSRPLQADGGPCNPSRYGLVEALRRIVNDPQTRRVFEVATQRSNMWTNYRRYRNRHLSVRAGFITRVEEGLRLECDEQKLVLCIPVPTAAQGLHAALDGLIQNWLLDPQAFDLVSVGEATIHVYLRGLGFDIQRSVARTATMT